MILSLLNRTEPTAMSSTQYKQLVGDLSNAIKTSYEKNAVSFTGGKAGAGVGGSTFLEGLGLSGLAKAYKEKAEAKEARRQSKADFVGNFQKYSEAGQNLSADTSRQVAESLFEEIDAKLQDLKKLEEEAKNRKEAGYGEDKNNTEAQNKLIEEIKKLQPNNGNAENSAPDKAIAGVQDEERKVEQAETQQKQYEVEQKTSDDLTALYTISDDYFKKMIEKTDKMLEALETIKENGTGGGGGLLGAAADLASMVPGKGPAGTAGKVATAATGASKFAKFAKIGGGLLAVGTAAYEGYTGYQDAEKQVQEGKITKEEGQVKKGEAVGGAIGGAGGALAGAQTGAMAGAALGSFIPGVGTVIGGAVGGLIGGAAGYFGGKYVGEKAGGGAVSGYQTLTGAAGTLNNPTPASGAPSAGAGASPASATNSQTTEFVANEPVIPGKPLSAKQVAVVDMAVSMGNKPSPTVKAAYDLAKQAEKSTPVAPAPQRAQIESGAALKDTTRSVEVAKEAATGGGGNTTNVVNAPVTNVNNTSKSEAPTKPTPKNEDSTFNRYMDRRYYPARSF